MVTKDFKLTTSDGKYLYGKSWVPDTVNAVVCLAHGLGEHISRYDHLANHFCKAGIAVYGTDQRGHGRNPGIRAHAKSQLVWDDLEALMKYARIRHLDAPVFLYGHSWGGNIVANFLLRKSSDEIKGAILSSPWLKLSFTPSKGQLLLAKIMSRIVPSLTQSNGLDPEFLSRDQAVGQEYLKDPLVHTKISAGLFNEAVKNGAYALEHASTVSKPILIFHGTDDNITSIEASKAFADASSLITFRSWSDMRHETHNELGKEEVLDFTVNWIRTQLD